jgi:tetratricopeptide (TPR) repeat protein
LFSVSLAFNFCCAQEFTSPIDKGEESSGTIEMYHLNVGMKLRKGMDLDSSLWHLQQAQEIFSKAKVSSNLGICHKEMGTVYCMSSDFEAGLEQYNKAIQIFIEVNDSSSLTTCYANLGGLALSLDNYDDALIELRKAQNISRNLDNEDVSGIIHNIGLVHLEQEIHWDSALYYLREAEKLAEQSENYKVLTSSLANIALLYFRQDVNDSALHYFGKSLNVANKHNLSRKKLNALNNLREVYYEINDLEGAYHFQEAYYLLKDSLFGVSTQNHIADLEIEFQTSENEVRLAKLESANSIQTIVIAALVVIFTILVFGVWKFFSDRRKRMHEIADALYRGRKMEHKKVASHLVDDVGGAIDAAAHLMNEDLGKARVYLEMAKLKISRLANLNYSQALETSGIRGALEELIRSMHEETGKYIESKIIIAQEPSIEKQEDIFELTEKLLLHTIKINNPELLHLEVRCDIDTASIKISRVTEQPTQSSTVYRNIEATVEYLKGSISTSVDKDKLATTLIEI